MATTIDLDDILISPHKYRNASTMQSIIAEINRCVTKDWNIMEVCGGQTFALARYGIEELITNHIHMIHGPGCPVCVTPQSKIDEAIEIAGNENTIFCSFGDMIRVPGSNYSLSHKRSEGADIRVLYSPLDTLQIAIDNPAKEVVFFAIGFETTTPIYAILIRKAEELGIKNLSLLTSLYTVPPAVYALASDPDCSINALLAAGHVCAITGESQYEDMVKRLDIPVIITGFEPVDILLGILLAIRQLEKGEHLLENPYKRAVCLNGNNIALSNINEVFTSTNIEWRGLGVITMSGMCIAKKYELYDSTKRFPIKCTTSCDTGICISGSIMKGLKQPKDCNCFGTSCTREHPIGAPMVSSEGVCAAYLINSRI